MRAGSTVGATVTPGVTVTSPAQGRAGLAGDHIYKQDRTKQNTDKELLTMDNSNLLERMDISLGFPLNSRPLPAERCWREDGQVA